MDYKKKIITLLDKVKTEQTFKQVYKLLEYPALWLRPMNDQCSNNNHKTRRHF